MSGRHVGGTPGWKALRGTCPVCGRDAATGPDYRPSTDPMAGMLRRVKRHYALGLFVWCTGEGRTILAKDTWPPKH